MYWIGWLDTGRVTPNHVDVVGALFRPHVLWFALSFVAGIGLAAVKRKLGVSMDGAAD